jgi:hypothetical protein
MTAFPSDVPQHMEFDWWFDIVGEPSDEKTSKPKSGEYIEIGRYDPGKLILHIQHGKIDWVFTVDEQDIELNRIPSIGPFPDILEIFLRPLRNWFNHQSCPVMHRIAFGAIVFLPVSNHQEGYETLSLYLPAVKLDPSNSSDFLYQINRPRELNIDIPELRINRLSKWSVFKFEAGVVSLRADFIDHTPKTTLFACRLELDINTRQDFDGEINPNQIYIVFDELVSSAKEIISEGDK